ncbi:MAG TPA: hypothetical protein VKP11_11490 [Frankiaceae bacterium]|nr:hypothetical protein [Frankiaceae bacterium]
MGDVGSAVDALAAEEITGLDAARLAADLLELRLAMERLEVEWLRRLAAFGRR